MSNEMEWRPVVGFPHYAVSDRGDVKRILPNSVGRYAGQWLKPSVDRGNYKAVKLYRHNGTNSTQSAHRLVAMAFLEISPNRSHVAHRDGDRQNNAVSNLRWSTSKENMADRVIHGTAPIGERHARALLTDAIVLGIRAQIPNLVKGDMKRMAAMYGVADCVISDVISGKTWKHLR